MLPTTPKKINKIKQDYRLTISLCVVDFKLQKDYFG